MSSTPPATPLKSFTPTAAASSNDPPPPANAPDPSTTPPPPSPPIAQTTRLQFSALPTDIKHLIFAHIYRPTDLVSLCLTSHECHELAVRQLYHTVTLDVGCESDKRLTAFLKPRNIGLKYIRNVELYRADVVHNCNQMMQADLTVKMLLEFLPGDVLEKFSWHPWTPLNADSLVLLYKTQRKMKWLEAIAIDREIDDCLKKDLRLDTVVGNVTKLGLYPDSRDTLHLAHELLVRMKKVEKLTLHANFEDAEPLIPSTELNDSSMRPGLVTTTIFSHMMPFDKCTPMVLNELTLQKVYLRFAADSYCRLIDFSKLKTLRVFGCLGADTLFAELSKSYRLPDKLETLEFKHEDDSEGEALSSLDGFLTLVSGLKRLTIDIACAKGLPAPASITRHSRTLNLLSVHAYDGEPSDSDDDEHVYSADDFTKLCETCTHLEQLSASFPATPIARSPSDDFAAFTAAVAKLPKLVTLNLTSWPTNQPTTNRLPRKLYELLLQGMAQSFMSDSADEAKEHRRASRLNVIAFGTSEKIYEREDGKNCVVFVKARQIDPLGRGSEIAVPMGWCLRKYVEGRSDVLDFALMRSVRPPTRDPPPSDENPNDGW